jgi:4-hydroxymandelate oxidase
MDKAGRKTVIPGDEAGGRRPGLAGPETGVDGLRRERRTFLKYLAASPILASSGFGALAAEFGQDDRDPLREKVVRDYVIKEARDALNVFDFEASARQKLPPAHWGYLSSGVMDEVTLHRNQAAFREFGIRARRLADVEKVDPSIELFGRTMPSPIMLSPVGGQRAFNPLGEIAVARAAKSRDATMILSTATNTSIEDINNERGMPVWYQVYVIGGWNNGEAVVKRAEAAGCEVVVLTVDILAGRDLEWDRRIAQLDGRDCTSCHGQGGLMNMSHFPMFEGLASGSDAFAGPRWVNWDFVKRLRDVTRGKLLIKGIVTPEDAATALKYGADGIIVSNHGGRADESGIATIEVLSEIVTEVKGKAPILIDSGFRRGGDVFKAMALGAKAVGIGRPYLWGLSSFGQEGVETVIDLLRKEFELTMRQAGTPSVKDIGAKSIRVLAKGI